MKNYNRIGRIYDATRRADGYLVSRLTHHLGGRQRGVYLDAACGTGNYTIALAALAGGSWHGIDCSAQMIKTAKSKNKTINWQLADIAALPFTAGVFDGAICTLALHHFESLPAAFGEIGRVLKQGGAFVIFMATPEQIRGYWLAEYFPAAIEKSAVVLPGFEAISGALREAGFGRLETEHYSVREDLCDLFLYSGKYRPKLYLNADVRTNISTFALLADEAEVETGCRRLAADIESGRIGEIIERHRNSSDYLFVIAEH